MGAESNLDRELLELERQYWDAIREKDASAAGSLSDEPCVVVGPRGIGELDRRMLAGMLEHAPWELAHFDLEDIHVHRLADDVAVLAYKVKEDLVVDGRGLSMQAFDASVWVRRDGRWVCALHTESVAGDPFGRN
jgi:ketosteroid isomerase-like protein